MSSFSYAILCSFIHLSSWHSDTVVLCHWRPIPEGLLLRRRIDQASLPWFDDPQLDAISDWLAVAVDTREFLLFFFVHIWHHTFYVIYPSTKQLFCPTCKHTTTRSLAPRSSSPRCARSPAPRLSCACATETYRPGWRTPTNTSDSLRSEPWLVSWRRTLANIRSDDYGRISLV